ncbi:MULTISPECIES: GntR family transcriptional regulator [Thalassospira]|jgi:DNA-binding GntR family transcriptional regulator|uniref:GntR family transcriptional regulator n=2 Tax=Thalassospira tepidiphila TaxID=393657 RepID=A0A853KUN6_9PROT|nr:MULTISPECIES: GntR family transcriptional regulator [Thalassospira]KXJ50447.1 MAG: GntR family transcriptional regulator [Thalassospira sp. Nap_22]EKF08190.1 GntR family transcriptional regulator [Thalassospira profundimaris WP0211]KZC99962.1 GntR family transcriptional regulator [Thalassospira sp. MCCC 1A02898]MBO6580836.1 GntR family transcriptional regulator [Thalassospira sp.]MBO6804056.1 GntR family transcriptional regulator [Thalassospira sp.]
MNTSTGGLISMHDGSVKTSMHVPASALVYEEVRNQIVSLSLLPETTLVRAELAESFNVSQSPVREAILRLEQDGLVVSYPQSRTVVTKIDVARIREEHFLRVAAECEVVRQLAEAKDSPAVVKAKGIVKMQEALVGDIEQIDLFKQLDETFHAALFNGVNQSNLHLQITARSGHLARVRTLDLPRAGKMVSVLEGHKAIIDAVQSGDGALASLEMRKHLSGTMERLPQIIEENKTLFS